MYKIAVIADDFTSVTDCTISFACKGMSTIALTGMAETEYSDTEVIGINTESRTSLPEEAYIFSRDVAAQLKTGGCDLVYKSVDSTLRGNLGAEIDGVMDGYGFNLAFAAPAFPHYGRTTVEGVHYLNGILLENSPIAKDPTCPAKDSVIRKILEKQSKRKIGNIGLDVVRGSQDEFKCHVDEMRADGYEIIVMDAETEDDLSSIAKHVKQYSDALIIGSTGLIRHVSSCYPSTCDAEKMKYKKSKKPVIIAAASVSPITKGQVELVLDSKEAELCLLDPVKVAFGKERIYDDHAQNILKQQKNLILYVDSAKETREYSEQECAKHNITSKEMGNLITAGISSIAKKLLNAGLSESIIMTGGDMAKASLETLDGRGMVLYDEVEPGIPLGRMIGDDNYLMVTKAGAFGTSQALLKAIQLLRED